MKKRLKVITAFLLMIVMAASGTCVFAGTDVQPAGDEPQAALDVVGEGEAVDEALPEEELPREEAIAEEVLPEEAAAPEEEPSGAEVKSEPIAGMTADDENGSVELMALPYIDTSLTATTMNYSTTKKPAWTTCSYMSSTSGDYVVAEINVKSNGKLWIDAQRLDSNSYSDTVYVGKYDASTDKMLEYSYEIPGYLYTGNAGKDPTIGIGGLDVVKGGTYYIVVRKASGTYSEHYGTMRVRPYVYSYATRSLSAGKWMLTSANKTINNYSNALYKIKPSKSGYILVTLKQYGFNTSYGSVCLLNSKKKTVSDKLTYSNGSYPQKVVFGVKKGTTYYLKVTSCLGSSDYQYKYGISYKIYAAPLRSNTSKSKAKTLKRKAKYISTAMPATGKSSSQWYKFKVTKKRATQINIDTRNIKYSDYKSVKMTVTIYCGKKKVGSTSLVNGKVNPIEITYSTTYGKAKKGTYYVKITKSAKANGVYKIKYAK